MSEQQEETRPTVLVVGHRNPDTDSIAAAVGLAELRSQTDPAREWVPRRLGDLTPQTAWVLEQSGVEAPPFLADALPQVVDVMRREFPVVSHEESIRDAGALLVAENLEVLPVVDDSGVLVGVLTEERLARRYVRESREPSRLLAPTTIAALVESTTGELVAGDEAHRVTGRVWVLAMDVDSMLTKVGEGDVVVVGDREDVQLRAVEGGVGVVVLGNGVRPTEAVLAAARERGTNIICSPLDSYVAARLITLASPCRSLVDPEPLTVRRADAVADASELIAEVSYRAAVVVDRQRRPIGLLTRGELADAPARQVALVDHAEVGQSVPGIEEAEIVEIIDHHHIGSIETRTPVKALFDPIGSSATLVLEQFEAAGIEPREGTAKLLLSAILADTVILTSPTTTDRDRRRAALVAERLGLDVQAYGREMFEAGSDVADVPAEQLLGRDAKTYEVNGGTLCLAQVEVVGHKVLAPRMGELRDAVRERAQRDGHRLVALMVTDVLAGDTQLVVAGDTHLAERAFGASAKDGVLGLPGVMSRKKQVAPPLLAAA